MTTDNSTEMLATIYMLQALEFVPNDDSTMFDLRDGNTNRIVRVVIEDGQTTIHLLTGNEIEISQIRLMGASLPLLTTTLFAAITEANGYVQTPTDILAAVRKSKNITYVLCETASHGTVPHPLNIDPANLPPCTYPHEIGPAGVDKPIGHPLTSQD
jgi:hypothetical protein